MGAKIEAEPGNSFAHGGEVPAQDAGIEDEGRGSQAVESHLTNPFAHALPAADHSRRAAFRQSRAIDPVGASSLT